MKTVLLRFGVVLPFASISPAAFAEIDKGGVLNEVSDRFLTEAQTGRQQLLIMRPGYSGHWLLSQWSGRSA
ncbi:hypothetical protein [Escherichia coli]|uniref:hypothetical protein n=1 Tax=Escherichia coli TaxID=562 RepID=UPI0020770419|nr:hypothetical protein [Escherichia coli]